jgi:hypothetical protein
VIGGSEQLREVAASVGIRDKRLIFSNDAFDTERVTTQCYDGPPKGRSAKPVAHVQSMRFLRLGAVLKTLKLPVFVSDIDLLFQRGVKHLMERSTAADVVFNEKYEHHECRFAVHSQSLAGEPDGQCGAFLALLAQLSGADAR